MQLVSVNMTCRDLIVLINLWVVVRVSVSVELPDVDAIVLSSRNHHVVVQWVEHRADEWIGMPNESLEEMRHSLLGVIVPHLKQVVLSTSQHVSTVR